ncbi:hemerythrin [Gammaproteobacteria bacterium]
MRIRVDIVTALRLLPVVALAGMMLVAVLALLALKSSLLQDKKIKTRHLVENTHSILTYYQELQAKGELTESQAKAAAIAEIHALRYDRTEYFWINDQGTPYPRMIMHPTISALDGQILNAEKFNRAVEMQMGAEGPIQDLGGHMNLFVAMCQVVREAGEGYVAYVWPKPLAGGGTTDVLFPKVSFVKGLKGWNWVIGSGIYIDDVETIFWKEAWRLLVVILMILAIYTRLIWWVSRYLTLRLGGSLETARLLAKEVAAGHLNTAIPLRDGDRDSFMHEMESMRQQLLKVVQGIILNSEEIASNVSKLMAEATQMEVSIKMQSHSNEAVQKAIHGVKDHGLLVVELARETRASSDHVAMLSVQGATKAQEVVQGIQRIAESMTRSSQDVKHLKSSSAQIGGIANIIRSIADQTNLLALNAAIEAARAGEQGRGFAVVADEVRHLAKRTGDATADITQMIKTIQEDTQHSVDRLDAVGPELAEGSEQVRDTAQLLETIKSESGNAQHQIMNLSNTLSSQLTQAEEVVQRVDHMIDLSIRTNTIIQDATETSQRLEQSVENLNALVRVFDVVNVSHVKNKEPVRSLLVWDNTLSTGVAEIDKQHRRLLEMANRLNQAMLEGSGKDVIGRILDDLTEYVANHFRYEEDLMDRHHYVDKANHIKNHRDLVVLVMEKKDQFAQGRVMPVGMMNFLRDWLVNHIMMTDRALGKYLNSKGIL